MKPSHLFLLCIAFPIQLLSQKKSFEGYIINNNNDTSFCKIFYKDRSSNPASIKVFINNETKEYTLADLKGFGIYEYFHYIKANVTFHPGPVTGSNLPNEFSDKTITREVFLQRIVNDIYSLYQLTTDGRTYYFVGKKGSPITELVYRVKEHEKIIEEDDSYKRQLYVLLTENGIQNDYEQKINLITYSVENIKPLINALNTANGSKIVVTRKKSDINTDVFIGVIYNFYPSEFDGRYAKNVKFSNSSSVTGGLNAIVMFPSRFKKLGIGLSIGYNHYKGNGNLSDTVTTIESPSYYYFTKWNESYSFKKSALLLNLYSIFFVNNFSKYKFYVRGGISYVITLKTNELTSKYSGTVTGIRNGNIPFSSSEQGEQNIFSSTSGWVHWNAALGISYLKHKVEVAFYNPVNINTSIFKDQAFKVGSIGFCYYYSFP